MSVNIVNSDLSLKQVAGNSNITVSTREATIGKIDVIFTGTQNTGTCNLTKSFTNYDYIDIEFGNSAWLAFNSIRYATPTVSASNSSNKLRFYLSDVTNLTFYRTSDTSLYFTLNKLVVRKIIGYKMGITKATITNPSQGDLYTTGQSTNIVGKWIDGKNIYRTMYEYKLTSSTSSNLITIPHSITFKNIVKCNCFVVNNGATYKLPYISSSGNSISLSTITSGNDISFVNKGLTWGSGTTFRIIVEYTL